LKKIFSGNFNIFTNNLIGVKAAKVLWCLENQFDNSSFAFKQIMVLLFGEIRVLPYISEGLGLQVISLLKSVI
jgi:hypothetical protein